MSVWKAFGDGLRDGLQRDSGNPEKPAPSALPPEKLAPSAPPEEPTQRPAADPRRVNKIVLSLVAVVAVVLLIGLAVAIYNKQKVGNTDNPRAQRAALSLLQTIPVKGRAPKTGYSRFQFGQPWTDDVDVEGGHNHCDTRNDILRRDLSNVIPSRGCIVQSGVLHDPYNVLANISAQKTSAAVAGGWWVGM